MAEIQNLDRLMDKLKKLEHRYDKKIRREVIVGYSAAYAVYVHENIEMKWRGVKRKGKDGKGRYWDPQGQGQSKFLEQPARELQPELARVAREVLENGGTMREALLAAGMRLQRKSMELVPIDTGNLRASAFTDEVK